MEVNILICKLEEMGYLVSEVTPKGVVVYNSNMNKEVIPFDLIIERKGNEQDS